MPQQYFSPEPESPSRPVEIRVDFQGKDYHFTTDSGVFSKDGLDTGTRLLLETLPALQAGQRGLDLGCGWGPVGVIWASLCPQAHITCLDINRRAVALTGQNLERNSCTNAKAVEGDGPGNAEGLFHVIALNPPIRTGKETIYRLFSESVAKLQPGGTLYIVIRVKQGAESAKRFCRETFGRCETVNRGAGFHVLAVQKQEGMGHE